MRTLDLLVDGLFDYAGMYPPASLSLEAALDQSARHAEELARPGLVSAHMVVRQELLPALSDEAFEAAGWPVGEVCRIVVVGVPLEDAPATLAKLGAYNARHTDSIVPRRVVSLEAVLEGDLVGDGRAAQDAMAGIRGAAGDIAVFVEPRWETPIWRTGAARLFQLLQPEDGARVGLKLRCAGPTAVTRGTMADMIAWAASTRAPLKATQGLHHPVIEERWGNEWGFLNLVMALRLRAALGADLTAEEILRLLAERDARAFTFDAERAAWRERSLSMDGLRAAMDAVPFAIGSCSILEPDADLARLFD